MTTNFIQIPTTGVYAGTFSAFRLTVPGTGNKTTSKITLIPLKSFDVSGLAAKNSYLSYFGLESGKYPYVLDVQDPFTSAKAEKTISFNPAVPTSGLYWYGAPGDGLYYWVE